MARTLDASDFIKPYTAEPEEVLPEQKGLTPFDFIKSVSNNKKDLLKDNPENAKEYNAFMVNRGLSFYPDTVLIANEMNLYPEIPAESQYYYYMSAIRKGNRFSEWHKKKKDDDLDLVQRAYQVRRDVAKQYIKLLSKEDLAKLNALTDTTGENKKKTK
jgi:hypothetical protein